MLIIQIICYSVNANSCADKFIKNNTDKDAAVVTVDADDQHKPNDAAEAEQQQPQVVAVTVAQPELLPA